MPEIQTLSDMAASVGAPKEPVRPNAPRSAEAAIAADVERRERERLTRRKEIRQQIKQRAVLMQSVSDLESQLRSLDGKADAAAEKHAAATAPIQERLQGATGAKRAKLLEELTSVNIELERELEVIGRTRNPLLRQHRETRVASAGLPVENRLGGADVGTPALLAEKHAGECRLAAAQMRVERAREMLSQYEPQLQAMRTARVPESSYGWTREGGKLSLDYDTIHSLTLRVARWHCELVHAESELHEATAALAEIGRELIAE